MEIVHSKSTFPLSLGAKIFGVDDATFTSTGEAFSAVGKPRFSASLRASRALACELRRLRSQSSRCPRATPPRSCRPTTRRLPTSSRRRFADDWFPVQLLEHY